MSVRVGDFVRVPLGPRRVNGVVWQAPRALGKDDLEPKKIKSIVERLDVPALSEQLRQFVDWVAAYVMSPPGSVLRQVMRVPTAFEPAKPLLAYRLDPSTPEARPEKMTAARTRVFAALAMLPQGMGLTGPDLAREANVSSSVIKGLLAGGFLQTYPLPGHKAFAAPEPDHVQRDFSGDQKTVTQALSAAVAERDFTTHLLDGVTGSGKTEVYFEAIAQA